jgi:hypothetical protein
MDSHHGVVEYFSHHPARNHCHIASLRMMAAYWLNRCSFGDPVKIYRLDNEMVDNVLLLQQKYPSFELLFDDLDRVATFYGLRKMVHLSGTDCSAQSLREIIADRPAVVMGRQNYLNWYDFYPEIRLTRVGHMMVFYRNLPDGAMGVLNPYEKILDSRWFPAERLDQYPGINDDKGPLFRCTDEYLMESYWDVLECRHIMVFVPEEDGSCL